MTATTQRTNRIGQSDDARAVVELAIVIPTGIMAVLPGVKVPKLLAFATAAVIGLRAVEQLRKLQ